MTNVSNKTINFIGAPEKRVRHRLGLGSLDMIKIDDLLEIAKNLGEFSAQFRLQNCSVVKDCDSNGVTACLHDFPIANHTK